MDTIKWIIATAPEIFLLLAIAIGTFFGRLQIRGFSVGATACTLVAAVLLGQLGNFVIPPLFKSIFFSLFVFTIGYKSGPEFFASLSFRTLSQVGVAVVVSVTGLALVLVVIFAVWAHSFLRSTGPQAKPEMVKPHAGSGQGEPG